MPQPEQYDVLILGSGAGGKPLAGIWQLRDAGRPSSSAAGSAAPAQHRLPAEQERDSERGGRPSGAPRREFGSDRPRHGRHGDGAPAQARHGRGPIAAHLEHYKASGAD